MTIGSAGPSVRAGPGQKVSRSLFYRHSGVVSIFELNTSDGHLVARYPALKLNNAIAHRSKTGYGS